MTEAFSKKCFIIKNVASISHLRKYYFSCYLVIPEYQDLVVVQDFQRWMQVGIKLLKSQVKGTAWVGAGSILSFVSETLPSQMENISILFHLIPNKTFQAPVLPQRQQVVPREQEEEVFSQEDLPPQASY
jgi:hypothetical protein